MKYTLNIDVSMLAIQTTLIDENNTCQQAKWQVPVETNYATITPKKVFHQVLEVLKQIGATVHANTNDDIQTINFSEIVVDGLIPLDKDFVSLTPVIYGTDTKKYVDALTMNGVTGQLQRKMGLPLMDTTPLILILWLKNERPDIYEQAMHYMSLQSYLMYRLFNINVTSRAYAARTGLYNFVADEWDAQALALAGLKTDHLPEVTKLTTHSLRLSDEIIKQTGISGDTIFHLK